MAISDPIADMLTRIRNAIMVGHESVRIPASKIKIDILQLFELFLCKRLGVFNGF